jgi:hypothetical protein
MTLGDCIQLLSQNPKWLLWYSIFIPVIILVLNVVVGKEDAVLSPWKYFYSTLIYLVTVPGIFSVFFSIYLFLFERSSIYDTNLYVQVLPVVLMILAIYLIKITIDLRDVPGFGKLSGLIMTISIVMILMWLVDKTHIGIVAFTYMPIQYLLIFFVVFLFGIRFGIRRIFG